MAQMPQILIVFDRDLVNFLNTCLLVVVSNLLVSLGHTGRRRVVLGHMLNTQTLTKTDEQKKGFK